MINNISKKLHNNYVTTSANHIQAVDRIEGQVNCKDGVGGNNYTPPLEEQEQLGKL